MPSVCFYFQIHQPFRVRRFSYFDSSHALEYFDDQLNSEVIRKVAHKSYIPANKVMLDLLKRYNGAFKVAYSVTGVAIQQMQRYCPEAIESFVRLAETGHVEFLSETFYHSLAALYSEQEFRDQVARHGMLIENLFGQRPTVFRNTELIYNDYIGQLAHRMGYKAVLAEGVDDILGWRSPNFIYSVAGTPVKLMLKNYRLSDDVAFRFSDRNWPGFPLTADRFADWIHNISGAGEVVNLFLDYETFGEHQWESTGIFKFLEHLPQAVLGHAHWDFCTPSEAIQRYRPAAELPFYRLTSWADAERDLTAWTGNRMQNSALRAVYALEGLVKSLNDPNVLDVWGKLQSSDHFYYMCTKWFADADVHRYFSPFESPYDAFINYMNVLRAFRSWLQQAVGHMQDEVMAA